MTRKKPYAVNPRMRFDEGEVASVATPRRGALRCNINKLITTVIMAMVTGATLAATPQIKNVTAFQPYPWEKKVYISYECEGMGGDRPVIIQAKDKKSGKTYLVRGLLDDAELTSGSHKVVWDLEAQGVTINSTNVVFVVRAIPRYCVIDLSAGASSYPVDYMDEPPGGGFNTDEYKTTKLVLRLIGPGAFKMGGQYDVTLTKPFYCGIFEVTQRQYELVTGSNPSAYKGDMRPVESVSWNIIRGDSSTYNWPSSANVDPSTFMGRIQARTGLNFDLPTEAQWEYACRAGTTSKYNNGGDSWNDLKLLGRYYDNRSDGKGGYSDAHTKVGSYQPNAWGLYDMHGNVSEWCLDWYGSLSSGVTDPEGSSSGSCRVLRGGCWSSEAGNCAASRRSTDFYGPSYGSGYRGFRLVRTLSHQ